MNMRSQTHVYTVVLLAFMIEHANSIRSQIFLPSQFFYKEWKSGVFTRILVKAHCHETRRELTVSSPHQMAGVAMMTLK